jgi:hypothetical protein
MAEAWDTGLSPDVILAVEAVAAVATGSTLAQEVAETPTTGTTTAATVAATLAAAQTAQAPAQVEGANLPTTVGQVPGPLVIVEAFLRAERNQETGTPEGQYQEVNSIGCKGAYQFCPGTDMYAQAEAAGWTQAAQDSIAEATMSSYYDTFGSWQAVAEAWYGGPGNVGVTGDTQDDPTILEYSISVINYANDWLAANGYVRAFPYPLGGGGGNSSAGPPVVGNPNLPTPAVTAQGVPTPPQYIENIVDGLINDIPSIPIVGGAVKSALRYVLDPIASLADSWFDWALNAVNAVWNDVTAGFGQIESGVETAWNDAKAFASTVGQEVLHDAEDLYNDATEALDDGIHLAEGAIAAGLTAAENFATSAVDDVKQWVTDGLNDVELAVEAVSSTVEDFATTVGKEVLADAESLYNEAVAGVDALATLTEGAIAEAVSDVEQWATDAINDAASVASDALNALETDVIAPIFAEVEHIASDILPDLQKAVTVVDKVLDWLGWLATFPFTSAVSAYDSLANGTPRSFAESMVAAAQADEGNAFRRFQGMFD